MAKLEAFLAETNYESRICSPGNPHGDVSATFALDRVARYFWNEGFVEGLHQYTVLEEASAELKAAQEAVQAAKLETFQTLNTTFRVIY